MLLLTRYSGDSTDMLEACGCTIVILWIKVYAGVVSLATRRLSNISVNRLRRRNKSSIADVSKKKHSNVDVSKWRQKNVNVRKHSDISVSNEKQKNANVRKHSDVSVSNWKQRSAEKLNSVVSNCRRRRRNGNYSKSKRRRSSIDIRKKSYSNSVLS